MKKNSAGQIDKYKAQLVAKGFTQVEGINYFETFAPVIILASIRSILTIALRNNWPIDMFNFHSAFLNGELGDNEEVYMEQPLGYEERDQKRFCVQLLKSIYGLKQARHKWYEVVFKLMCDIGFHRSEADPAVFYLHHDGHILLIAIHVDDCKITGDSQEHVDKCKNAIKAQFSLTDLGPASWLLGIKITQNRKAQTLGLSQQSYIESILARFDFTDLKPLSTPMDPTIHYSKAQCPQTIEEKAAMRKIPYREAISALMYCAVATRPDIALPTALLSQFVKNPGPAHWEAVKHIFRYLLSMKTLELIYGETDRGLKGYADADGASQEHRHAISGYAFLIDGGAVSWLSKKQDIITSLTAEAEYVAATHAAKEAIWLKHFLSEVFQPIDKPIPHYCDSQLAIALTQDGSHHT